MSTGKQVVLMILVLLAATVAVTAPVSATQSSEQSYFRSGADCVYVGTDPKPSAEVHPSECW